MPAAKLIRHKPSSPHPPSAVLCRTTAFYDVGRRGRRTDDAWCLLPGSPRFQPPKPSQVGLSATSSSAYGTNQPLPENSESSRIFPFAWHHTSSFRTTTFSWRHRHWFGDPPCRLIEGLLRCSRCLGAAQVSLPGSKCKRKRNSDRQQRLLR